MINNQILILIGLALLAYFILNNKKEGLVNVTTARPVVPVTTARPAAPVTTAKPALPVTTARPAVPVTTARPTTAAPKVTQPGTLAGTQATSPMQSAERQQIDRIVAGKDQLTTADLLPKYDDANQFVKQNPVTSLLQEQNFLQAGYHMGINTVVQSNKIPYLDIRSCPPIPKNEEVSPWMVSSYEQPSGYGRRYLDIGS